MASEVGARVADPDRVAKLVAAASRQTAHPASVHWRDHAVGQGHAGLALLFGALDQHDPGQGWDRTAHRHLALAARAIEAVPRPPAGLFAGLAGLGLVATSCPTTAPGTAASSPPSTRRWSPASPRWWAPYEREGVRAAGRGALRSGSST